jgi:hypothetical protein
LDATLTVRDVREGDRIDIRVRVTDSSVRIDAERRDRRGNDGDDEDEDDDEDDDNEFGGVVSGLSGACPNITFTLSGTLVRASDATRYEDGTCARVRNSLRVEVHGQRQGDGSIRATRIELDDRRAGRSGAGAPVRAPAVQTPWQYVLHSSTDRFGPRSEPLMMAFSASAALRSG